MSGGWTSRRPWCRAAILSACLWPLVQGDGRAAAPSGPAAQADGSRVLLMLAAPGDARAAQQARIVAADRAGAAERDLVLVQPEAEDQGRLRRRYGVAPGRFAVLLIGKDGGVKLRSDAPLTARTLFDAIDAMPMRRAEMRRQMP